MQERYMITARIYRGCTMEYADYFPISAIYGNEAYYVRTTQSFIDAYNDCINPEMKVEDIEYNYDEEEQYSLFEIFDLVKEFLSTLDQSYVKDFDDMIDTGHLIVTDPIDIENGDQLDTNDTKVYDTGRHSSKNNEVFFPFHSRLSDSIILVHEFMHYELDSKKIGKDHQEIMRIFNEMNSIFHEYLFADFLNNKGLINKECKKRLLKRLYSTRLDAENVNIDSKIIRIARDNIPIAGLEYDENEAKRAFLSLRSSCLYFMGGAYGSVLYDRYKKGIIDYNNVKNFVETVPKSGYDDKVLNYIFRDEQLEFTNEELKDGVKRLFDEFELNSLNSKKVL